MTFLRATQDSYDALAATHLDVVSSNLTDKPLDRALFAVFAEWVRAVETPFQSRPAQSRKGSRHSPATRATAPVTEPPTASVPDPVPSPVSTAEPLTGPDPAADTGLVPEDAGPAADAPAGVAASGVAASGVAASGVAASGVVLADLPTGAGAVADIGCGPGRVTRVLADLGLNAFGIDLSPEMVAIARREHPDLRFDVGSMLALNIPDGALTGVLSNYSIINTPWQFRRLVFAEFHRVLAPGGQLMLVFQVGTDCRHYEQVDGVPIDLDFYRQQPEDLKALLAAAGFVLRVSMVREPDAGELTPRGYLLAQKPLEPDHR